MKQCLIALALFFGILCTPLHVNAMNHSENNDSLPKCDRTLVCINAILLGIIISYTQLEALENSPENLANIIEPEELTKKCSLLFHNLASSLEQEECLDQAFSKLNVNMTEASCRLQKHNSDRTWRDTHHHNIHCPYLSHWEMFDLIKILRSNADLPTAEMWEVIIEAIKKRPTCQHNRERGHWSSKLRENFEKRKKEPHGKQKTNYR